MKIIKKTLNVDQYIRYIKELFFILNTLEQIKLSNKGHVSQTEEVGSETPAEPSCRPAKFIFQYHPLWRFFKNRFYLKSSHRLKAIIRTLIIIVNSYNLD